MLRVHIARGTSLSLTRRVDGPLCIPVEREVAPLVRGPR
jgi:hypothetical protein